MMPKKTAFTILFAVIFSSVISGCVGQVPIASLQPGVFTSVDQIKTFLSENAGTDYGYYGGMKAMEIGAAMPTAAGAQNARASDYSTTNIQVAGVDETDFVKNDGKYIYTITGNGTVMIIDAFPASEMKTVFEMTFENATPSNLYVNGDRIIVIGYESQDYAEPYYAERSVAMPRYSYSSKTFVNVYDISDRANPVLKRNVTLDGDYSNSRMIGNYVYMITNEPMRYYGDDVTVPQAAYGKCSAVEGAKCAPPMNVYYFDAPDYSYQFTILTSINSQNDVEETNSKVYMTGYSQALYVSQDNIYTVYSKRVKQSEFVGRIADAMTSIVPLDIAVKIKIVMLSNSTNDQKIMDLGTILQDYSETLSPEDRLEFQKKIEETSSAVQIEIAKEMQRTVINKISVKNGAIEYMASGEVPGTVLNQFSMDEYNSYFRIATTTGNTWDRTSENNVYVLDPSMKTVGKVEDLAQGESIYSVRFIGNRGYLVTFKKIDPLFVIDLGTPENPKVLGYLKITGYSNYLHPYDETHIIGVGKETAGGNEQFSWYQGIKVSLFDVSDVENPTEVAKFEIGDRGTDSYALYDHKAFLFSKQKNLLVLPITLAEINASQYGENVPDNAYGEYVWQGAYVMSIDLSGISLKGKITHKENQTTEDRWSYYYNDAYSVKRSLYMDNTLYTVSTGMIKANSLTDISETGKVSLPTASYWYGPIFY